jgi:molybdopterin/thiamine biosynthesis adenylyltransferase
MAAAMDLTLLEPHMQRLQLLVTEGKGVERAAYMLLGRSEIVADPWTGYPRVRLVSHAWKTIEPDELVSNSGTHVTWRTGGFMRLLSEAQADCFVPALVHTHPGSHAFFSEQDDRNEAELARTARIKGTLGLVSVVLGGDGSVCARLWPAAGGPPVEMAWVQSVGGRLQRWMNLEEQAGGNTDHLERQSRIFGQGFNETLRTLRIGVVGAGGTGSPTALLLARLGVGRLLLLDKDVLEVTNLNRVHGSRREDAKASMTKVATLAREIRTAGLDVEVAIHQGWAGDVTARDKLKACDVIFGCTDDHSGRILLNRLAYFYGIPVIDVGLRMAPSQVGHAHDINGRVTTLSPGRPCLVCGGVVNPRRAAEEALERTNPDEFRRRKAEAYVIGGGDPAPAVVTFTTEMACVAVNELIAGITGFHGKAGMVPTRSRRFHARDDRFLAVKQEPGCPVCGSTVAWGRGDTDPFLDLIG